MVRIVRAVQDGKPKIGDLVWLSFHVFGHYLRGWSRHDFLPAAISRNVIRPWLDAPTIFPADRWRTSEIHLLIRFVSSGGES
jgi:hypothetical protein